MRQNKTRFITACQQILALGVVLAALTPAASVVSLDVVRESPTRPAATVAGSAALSAYIRASHRKSVVPTQVIKAKVSSFALTAAPGRKSAGLALAARSKPGTLPGSTELTTIPEPVTGYGAVGVTWAHGVKVAEDRIHFQLRTRTADAWSSWMKLGYDSEHGPDPTSAEGLRARPGTDALLVGNVDQVQVRAVSDAGGMPADMKLAVIDPGKATATAKEAPALDTATLDKGTTPDAPATDGTTSDPAPTDPPTDPATGLALQAATYTPKPVIYSRAQWGADESMRDPSSLHYGEVHAGFVHHTVNANDYTRDEVPGILRSIYAYHTQSRGWSDIGYNYLVDRFGRIWEGRYGGIDRPVVGAHTLNYNDYAFAMSAIGNYDIHQPSAAMLEAYGSLFAWKLSLHGVDAGSTKQWVGSRYFQAINGHRDAASTACPGRYLYAKLPLIRQYAEQAQRGWGGRELEDNLASTPNPDLIVRRASDGQAFVIPTGGMTRFRPPTAVSTGWAGADSIVATPDVTGDGKGDLVVRIANGTTRVYPGDGAGGFGSPVRRTRSFAAHDLITAVGDLNQDGHNDLVARSTATGRLDSYLGDGTGGFTVHRLSTGWGGYDAFAATGDVNGDGHADLLTRDAQGRLWLFPGTGTGHFHRLVQVPGSFGQYDTITGFGDFNHDGLADLMVRVTSTGYGYVLPSRGNGTFGHALGPIPQLKYVTGITGGGQMVDNAAPDLIARSGDTLTILRNAGTFDAGAPMPTGVDLRSSNVLLNAGDWDRDGFGDMITRSSVNNNLYLRRGDGAGHFGPATLLAKGFGGVRLLAAVGDMTGDGWPDLMGQPSGGDMRIYPGNGLSGLKPSYVAHSSIRASRQVAVGRFDGDGAPDSLFRAGNRLTLFPGNGPGGLTTAAKRFGLDLAGYDWVIGISDENLTGHSDLIAREKATGYLWLFRATSSGFSKRWFLGEGMNAYDLAD